MCSNYQHISIKGFHFLWGRLFTLQSPVSVGSLKVFTHSMRPAPRFQIRGAEERDLYFILEPLSQLRTGYNNIDNSQDAAQRALTA